MEQFDPATPICFISTHLDDVALSCSHFLSSHPNNTVLTVLAGAPKIYRDKSTDWNARTTGKSFAPNALDIRKDEDASAMSLLKSKPVWIDLPESLYVNGAQDISRIGSIIRLNLQREGPKSVVFPLGIHHSDHIAVSNACGELAKKLPHDFYIYLDMPYANKLSPAVHKRLIEFTDLGRKLESLEPYEAKTDIKEKVFAQYQSQYNPIKEAFKDFNETMYAPELYWRLVLG